MNKVSPKKNEQKHLRRYCIRFCLPEFPDKKLMGEKKGTHDSTEKPTNEGLMGVVNLFITYLRTRIHFHI